MEKAMKMEKDKAFKFIYAGFAGYIMWIILTLFIEDKTIEFSGFMGFVVLLSIGVVFWPKNFWMEKLFVVFFWVASTIYHYKELLIGYIPHSPVIGGVWGGLALGMGWALISLIGEEYRLKLWNYLFKPFLVIGLIYIIFIIIYATSIIILRIPTDSYSSSPFIILVVLMGLLIFALSWIAYKLFLSVLKFKKKTTLKLF